MIGELGEGEGVGAGVVIVDGGRMREGLLLAQQGKKGGREGW